MGRIVCVAGSHPVMRNGVQVGRAFVASHGIDEETQQSVPLPREHPAKLGARFDRFVGAWVLDSNSASNSASNSDSGSDSSGQTLRSPRFRGAP